MLLGHEISVLPLSSIVAPAAPRLPRIHEVLLGLRISCRLPRQVVSAGRLLGHCEGLFSCRGWHNRLPSSGVGASHPVVPGSLTLVARIRFVAALTGVVVFDVAAVGPTTAHIFEAAERRFWS